MNTLRTYLNSMTRTDQEAFAARCGTTVGYLRKAISVGQVLRETLALAIERESGGGVPLSSLRPDFDAALAASGYVRTESHEAA